MTLEEIVATPMVVLSILFDMGPLGWIVLAALAAVLLAFVGWRATAIGVLAYAAIVAAVVARHL
jgi:hypothetical protein